jgi:predicted RND superfamily exporter protein
MEEIDEQTLNEMMQSLLICSLVILAIILLITRSTPRVLATIIVNFAPISIKIIVLVALGLQLNIITAIIAVVCLGTIIDDTVHVLYALDSHKEDHGFGLILTTLLMLISFVVLSFSRFGPTSIFGVLAASIYLIALLADLFCLPYLINRWEKPRARGFA